MFDFLTALILRSVELLLTFLPYVVIGVLLAEILKYTSWADVVQRAVRKSPALSVLFAALLGMASPLCTYGTVPIIIKLYKKGTPLAPLITFLGASSLINPQLFLVTWGGFGLTFSLARLFSVFLFSLLLGSLLTIFAGKGKALEAGNVNGRIECKSSGRERDIRNFLWKEYLLGVWSTFKFIGKYLVLGVLLSVFLEAIVPISLLFERATREWLNILFAALVSIPVYICGGGVIPLVEMLMKNGMSTGAAMAFLIVGPATRITALTALGSFLSKRMVGFYVAFLMVFSLVLGLLLNRFPF